MQILMRQCQRPDEARLASMAREELNKQADAMLAIPARDVLTLLTRIAQLSKALAADGPDPDPPDWDRDESPLLCVNP